MVGRTAVARFDAFDFINRISKIPIKLDECPLDEIDVQRFSRNLMEGFAVVRAALAEVNNKEIHCVPLV